VFDQETQAGNNMDLYNTLCEGSIAATFSKRVASGLQTGRFFVIPNRNEQANETTDFELIPWLVIKAEG
jgi:hypothetical protein